MSRGPFLENGMGVVKGRLSGPADLSDNFAL